MMSSRRLSTHSAGHPALDAERAHSPHRAPLPGGVVVLVVGVDVVGGLSGTTGGEVVETSSRCLDVGLSPSVVVVSL